MITLLLLGALQLGQSDQIQLVCGGGGSADKPDGTSLYAYDNNGNSTTVNVLTSRRDQFEDQVDVVVAGADSKIRLPAVMLPPIHGGSGGWFKLKNVEVTEDTITGTASVNFMNQPKVHVDRRNGMISIDGKAGHYQGQCSKIDRDQPRKF